MSDLTPKPRQSFPEFVALIASLMALGALGIDSMLPALPVIGRDLHVMDQNHLQGVVQIYFLGMGLGQIIYGVLSDWLGRKRVLMTGVSLYVLLALVCAITQNFTALLIARLIQGLAIATTGVITRSIIRDLYSGPRMAKVMSMSYVVFLLVPIMAPSLGQLILLIAPWRGIFLFGAGFGSFVLLWTWLRLPETLAPEKRNRPDLAHIKRVAFFVVTEPGSLFYTLGTTFLIGALLAYVSLMPQIFTDVFRHPSLMAPVFAACAATMGASSFLNASLVEKLGPKRISHMALTGYLVASLTHLAWTVIFHESILSFVILQAITMGLMSLSTSNFGAIAMENVGHVAGTAASLQGVVSTVGAAVVSAAIGSLWRGNISLLPAGALVAGLIVMALILTAEKGKLYRRLENQPSAPVPSDSFH